MLKNVPEQVTFLLLSSGTFWASCLGRFSFMVELIYRFREDGKGVACDVSLVATNATEKEEKLANKVHSAMDKLSHGLGAETKNQEVFLTVSDDIGDLPPRWRR